MLQRLTITNYAIIDHLVVEPQNGLNIVTGETGAGKSIILGALSLILGERADTSVLIKKEKKCIVEAAFDVKNNKDFAQKLLEEDIDNEPQCIIRREINVNGKSRAFVNDTPVRLNVLHKLTSLLVDLHQQFDHLALDDDHFQMDVLDAVAGNAKLRREYSNKYSHYTKLAAQLRKLKAKSSEQQKEADYKQYLLDELAEAALRENEIEDAAAELKKLEHAEHITNVLQESIYSLNEGELPILNQLKRALQQLEGIQQLLQGLEKVVDRINSTHIELKDIAEELEGLSGDVTIDDEQIQQLQDKLDVGYKLLKKHQVQTTNELLAIQSNLEGELEESVNLDNEINTLDKELAQASKELLSVAKELSAKRVSSLGGFSKEVNKLLGLVGMPNALFEVALTTLNEPNELGLDNVQFLLDANKSGKRLPVHKAASGGEMSRIMLCIKSLTAQAMHMPTLIFDEVDTGVSGEAAKQVGLLLKSLSDYHQVICITHQPQVAAKASYHMYVYKEAEDSGRITTRISILDKEEQIMAVAKMIGGEQPGDAALQNAKELVTD